MAPLLGHGLVLAVLEELEVHVRRGRACATCPQPEAARPAHGHDGLGGARARSHRHESERGHVGEALHERVHRRIDLLAHAHLVHERAHHLRRPTRARRLGDRVELRVLHEFAAPPLQQLAQRGVRARHERALDAEGLVQLDGEHRRGRVVQEEVIHLEHELSREVELRLESLSHRARLRIVLVEVERAEGRRARPEEGGLQRGAHHAQLEDVLVQPHIHLRVVRDGRVGDRLGIRRGQGQHGAAAPHRMRGAPAVAARAATEHHLAAAGAPAGARARDGLLHEEQLTLGLSQLSDALRLAPLNPESLLFGRLLGGLELGGEDVTQLRLVLEQQLRLLKLRDQLRVLEKDRFDFTLGQGREPERLEVRVN